MKAIIPTHHLGQVNHNASRALLKISIRYNAARISAIGSIAIIVESAGVESDLPSP
jgi:hypothetical protein